MISIVVASYDNLSYLIKKWEAESGYGYSDSPRKVLFGAWDDLVGKFVGYGGLNWRSINNCVLASAYVLPEYRRQGIYNQLINERVKYSKRAGAEKIIVGPTTKWQSDVLSAKGFEISEHSGNNTGCLELM